MSIKKQVTSIIFSKPSIFGKLCMLTSKILQASQVTQDNFPTRREHYHAFLQTNLDPQRFNEVDELQKVLCLSLLIPSLFTEESKEYLEVQNRPKEFQQPKVVIPSQDLSYNALRIQKFLERKEDRLETLLKSDWDITSLFTLLDLSYGDILYLTNHIPQEIKWNECTEETQQHLLLQKNLYWFLNPSQVCFPEKYFFGFLPTSVNANEELQRMKIALLDYEPWMGPYTQERISFSLWKQKTSQKIITYSEMMEPFSSSFQSTDFDPVKVIMDEKPKSVITVEEEILQKCFASKFPKTFSILPDKNSFPPFEKGFTIHEFAAHATEEEVLTVLFQIIWTMAVLQSFYKGFQHNNLAESIRFVKYPKQRCFRLGTSKSFLFTIEHTMPLPVIVSFDSCSSLEEGVKVPQRTEESFDSNKDILDVCEKFRHCSVGEEIYELCKSTNLQNILFHEVFDPFLSKGGPKSSSIAMIENL